MKSCVTEKSVPAGHSELHGEAISLAERLLVLLGGKGSVLALGSLSGGVDLAVLAEHLGRAIQAVSSKPVLVVQAALEIGPEGSPGGSGGTTERGLTDILSGEVRFEAWAGALPVRGPASLGLGTRPGQATELIVAEPFRSFVSAAQGRFGWIILCCPQLLEQRHAASLVARSDAVVGTLRAGEGKAEGVRALQEFCRGLNRSLAGVILTQARPDV